MSKKDEYETAMVSLLLMRASGSLTEEEEDRILEALDDLWWEMSDEERREVNGNLQEILEREGLKGR